MRLRRRKIDGVVAYVTGFDADKVAPLVGAKVGHGFCFFGPGVPDDGVAGVFLGHEYAAARRGIFDFNRGKRVAVNTIGFRGENHVSVLVPFALSVSFVDVSSSVYAA